MSAPPATRRVALATGVTLAFAERGERSGVPVVLLPGYADSHRFYEPLLPYLPGALHVYAVTPRGHGDSTKPEHGYALADFAADVPAFLDAVGLERAVLLGHSSGGLVAQRCAIDRPGRVLGLVLAGAPRGLHGVRPPFAATVERMTDPVGPDLARAVLGAIPVTAALPESFVGEMVAENAKLPAHVWRAVLAGLTGAEAPTETGVITVPTLVLWGERDTLLGRGEQERLVAATPGARLVTYPDAGHLVAWDVPAALAADVAAFALGLWPPIPHAVATR
ncbi:alpha/beta fold hydrolase [Prauserella endophytica]|uniref:Alpha/beta hydrolase n=1 Tax=Prauserella endophytica TaxID=1592324 RepID=A0ABY2S886_9PSEU|nr:alpha/beta hydrolase [Prauserella endophytica]TKG72079.1 alpha/beta hydrolase [Prauserella endophytica]